MFLENIFRGPYSVELCIAFYPSSSQRKTQNRIDKTSSAEIHEFCNLSNLLKNENNEKKKKKITLSLQMKMMFCFYTVNYTLKPRFLKCSNTQRMFYARSNEASNLIQDFFWTFWFASSLWVKSNYFIFSNRQQTNRSEPVIHIALAENDLKI